MNNKVNQDPVILNSTGMDDRELDELDKLVKERLIHI